MKQELLKLSRFKLLVLSCVLVGICMFSTTDMTAQSAYAKDAIPQGNFVDVNLAILRLDAELESFQVLLAGLNPYSQAYRTLTAKYLYYDTIRERLAAGKETDPSAVALAITEVSKALGADAYGGLSKTLQDQFKQDVIQVLQ